jgi:hypothetical protein
MKIRDREGCASIVCVYEDGYGLTWRCVMVVLKVSLLQSVTLYYGLTHHVMVGVGISASRPPLGLLAFSRTSNIPLHEQN